MMWEWENRRGCTQSRRSRIQHPYNIGNYASGERGEVIRRAYQGLFQLVTPLLFDKYVDFIAERIPTYNVGTMLIL
jgi:hypothetical protein